VISEDLGHKLEKVELTQLGSVKKVTVTKDDTIMLHGSGATADTQRAEPCCRDSSMLGAVHVVSASKPEVCVFAHVLCCFQSVSVVVCRRKLAPVSA
jgi:chaperonin GroEL (HSP60 family)